MMHSTNTLYDMLRDHLAQINRQLAEIRESADKKIAALPYPEEVTVYMLKKSDGAFILEDMLAAKAQVLSAMTALKTAEMQQGGKR